MAKRHSLIGSRRSFITKASAIVGGASLSVSRLWAEEQPTGFGRSTELWDLTWLDTLKGRHRQVFSLGDLRDGVGLGVVTNWLDAHEEVFGLKPPQVNAVVGIANRSFPINVSDALWAKYELGKRYQVTDADTNAPAIRNIYLEGRRDSRGRLIGVKPLQARGVIFWQCNNALTAIAGVLAQSTNQAMETVKAELIAGLNAGVKLVPAHTMLLGLAQEHGCTYESIGG